MVWAAAGGLGCFLGGLLAERGVRAIGITSSAEKAAVALAAGYEMVINYRDEEPVRAVQETTDGGAHVVFDSVAGPEFARSFRMLRDQGTVMFCGRAAGEPDLGVAQADFVGSRRNLGLRDFFLNGYIASHSDELPARVGAILASVRDGRVRVPMRAYALEDAPIAHAALETGQSVGKLLLHP